MNDVFFCQRKKFLSLLQIISFLMILKSEINKNKNLHLCCFFPFFHTCKMKNLFEIQMSFSSFKIKNERYSPLKTLTPTKHLDSFSFSELNSFFLLTFSLLTYSSFHSPFSSLAKRITCS